MFNQFIEGMDSQRSNTATRLRKVAAAIFGVNALDMSPSITRQEKFCNMIGRTTNQHGRGTYSALKVEILHRDYSGVYDRQKVFLNTRLMAVCVFNTKFFIALIRGPNTAIKMVKGNFGIRPMTETMEILYHLPLIADYPRQSGVSPGMILFNSVGRPQVLSPAKT